MNDESTITYLEGLDRQLKRLRNGLECESDRLEDILSCLDRKCLGALTGEAQDIYKSVHDFLTRMKKNKEAET